MLCGPIDIDDELTSALENDKLVIFAGAGISIPTPSNIVDFSQLADAIGRKVGAARAEHEPEDRFLGRLEDGEKPVLVHQLARLEIIRENSTHTELHELLLRLFSQSSRVRIVTTNFDKHFNAAAKVVFGESQTDMPIYHAPALPLGDNFHGLVYLHGVLHEPQDRCVLTDRDFGAAYLTHGWARRFILRMFSQYTVLFVGYSHNDVVMNYLARGMPDSGRKYAFVPRGEEASWGFLRISCVSYERHTSTAFENKHIQISEACREWIAESQLSATKRHERLKHLYQEGPKLLKSQDSDFILRCLIDEESYHGFFKKTPTEEWIEWLLERGLLNFLFEDKTPLLNHQYRLIRWVIFEGFREAESVLWRKLKKMDFKLNPAVCPLIVSETRQRDKYGDNTFKRWLAVLLNQPEGHLSRDDFVSLIEGCKIPEEAEVALSILASQLQPKIVANSWDDMFLLELGNDEIKDHALTLNTCSHSLHELRLVWDDHLKPHLHEFAFLALQTFTGLLIAHRAKSKLIQNSVEEDIVSRARENVEPGHEVGGNDAIDLIISGAVQALEAWLQDANATFDCLARSWLIMDVPILRRLSVHGQSKRHDWNADQKIKWLIQQGDILSSERNREANLLLMRHYPVANEETRRQALNWLEAWSLVSTSNESSPELLDAFSIVSWLVKNAKCSQAQQLLDKIKGKLPPNILPWKNPEVGACSVSEDFFRPKNSDLMALDAADRPSERLDALLTMLEIEKHKHQKHDLVLHAIELGREDIDWAINFQNALIRKEVHDKGIWNAFFQLWREKELSIESWQKLLKSWLMVKLPGIEALDLIIDFLNGKIDTSPYAIPQECWMLATEVATHYWIESQNESFEEPDSNDVVSFALNTAPGEFTRFWVKYAFLRRKAAGDGWRGLPHNVEHAFNLIVSSSTNRAKIASIMLCWHFGELYRFSSEFASQRLAPMFLWPENGKSALWYWEAFLNSNDVWPIPLTEAFMPSFTKIVKTNALPSEAHLQAIDLASWLAIYRFENPLVEHWFEQLLPDFSDLHRVEYAKLLGVYLIKAQRENQSAYWRRWILDYCRQRRLGIPVPLSVEEAREMLIWCLGAGDCLMDALAIMKTWDVAPISYSGPVLQNFIATELPEKQPLSAAQLLTRLLQCFNGVVTKDQLSKLYERLSAAGAPENELERIRDEAIKIGIALGVNPE